MGKFSRLGNDLYSGKKSIDFVGRKWLWYSISGVIVLLAVGGLYFKGLNMGIEFVGGAQYRVTLENGTVDQDDADAVREAVAGTGIEGAASPVVITSGESSIIVQTKQLNTADSQEVVDHHPGDDERLGRRDVAGGDRRELGTGRRQAVADRPGRLPHPRGAVHLGLLPRMEDVGGGDRGAGPRRDHHRRRLRRCRASRCHRRP